MSSSLSVEALLTFLLRRLELDLVSLLTLMFKGLRCSVKKGVKSDFAGTPMIILAFCNLLLGSPLGSVKGCSAFSGPSKPRLSRFRLSLPSTLGEFKPFFSEL
jgi:hypothetical protein